MQADDDAIDPIADDDQIDRIERWLVDRGLPHLVDRRTDGSALDAWTRALPLLVTAYLLLGLQALDLREWTLGENLAAAAVVLTVAVATWVASNRLRGVAAFARPTDIDTPELVLFLVGPTLPVLLFGQVGDAIETVLIALVLLALIYVWSAYGMGPLLRWGVRRTMRQANGLLSLVARALPLLLVFNAFLFINAEVWEVAGTLDGLAFWVTIVTFALLGGLFALTRLPALLGGLGRFDDWNEVDSLIAGTPAAGVALPTSHDRRPDADRPSRRQRLNIGLVVLFGQALQITLVVAAIVGFFVGFGVVAISLDTTLAWTRLESTELFLDVTVRGQRHVLSEPLLRVATFLGAFSGMYFTVLLTTDETYRAEFEDEAGPAIREALAVRTAYRVAQGVHPAASANDTEPPPTTGDHTTRDNGVA